MRIENARFLKFVLIMLVIIPALPSLYGLEYIKSNNYPLFREIDYSLYRTFAYEHTVYELSLQIADRVQETIDQEPRRIRQRIDITRSELAYQIPHLVEFSIINEVLSEREMTIGIRSVIDKDILIERLLSYTPSHTELLTDYRRDLFSELTRIDQYVRELALTAQELKTQDFDELRDRLNNIKISQKLLQGDLEYLQKNYVSALDFYNAALEINRNRPDIYRKLYRTYSHLDEHKKGINTLDSILALEPDDSETIYLLGNNWEILDDKSKAVSYYQRLEQEQLKPETAFFLANYFHEQNARDEARRYAIIAAGVLDVPSDFDRELATILIEFQLYMEAKPILQRVLIKEPRNFELYKYLGDISYRNDDYPEALIFYEQAVKIKSDDYKSLLNLANCHFAVGNYPAAVRYYREALLINDEDPTLFYNLGNALFKTGDYSEAAGYYRMAISLGFRDAEIYFNLGNVYYMIPDYEQSVENYEIAIEQRSDYTAAMFNLANTLEKINEPERALAIYRRIIEIDPQFYMAFYNIGNYYKLEGKLETAIEYYQLSIAINDRDEFSYSNMGDCYRMLGHYDEAEDAYLRAIEIDPQNPIPYNNLSLTYYLQENFIKSLEYLRKAAKLGHYNASDILRNFNN